MLAPPPLRQMMDGIKSISEQNDNDLLDMQAHDPSKHPFHQFICEKMQTLQEVIEIAIISIHYAQELQEEKDGLDKINHGLKQDLNRLCQINIKLEERVEELMQQLIQSQQFARWATTDPQIQSQQIFIQTNQFPAPKQKINKNLPSQQIRPEGSESVQSPLYSSGEAGQEQKKNQQKQTESHITTDHNLVQQLESPSKFPQLVSSGELVSLYRLKIKNKLSQLSHDSLQNLSVSSRKWRVPVKLNEELWSLNLNSCNSIFQIEPDERVNETKQTEESVSVKLNRSGVGKKAMLERSNGSMRKNKSAYLGRRIQNVKVFAEPQNSVFGAFVANLSKLHTFFYQRIVKGRIAANKRNAGSTQPV